MISVARWKEITKTTEEILESLNSRAGILTRAITAPIFTPVLQQMSRFHAKLLEYLTVVFDEQPTVITADDVSRVNDAAVSCIDWCLIAVQNIQKAADQESLSLCDMVDRTILIFQSFQLDILTSNTSNMVELMQGCANEATSQIAYLTIPFLRILTRAYSLLASDLCQAHKSFGKLLYVSLRVFRTLLAKGLCSGNAEDSDGDGTGNSNTFEDSVEGTGMGDGDGLKDVSDQIQSEDQLEGLRDEGADKALDPPKNPLTEEDRDKGVEMQQEFDGEMHDVPGITFSACLSQYRNFLKKVIMVVRMKMLSRRSYRGRWETPV